MPVMSALPVTISQSRRAGASGLPPAGRSVVCCFHKRLHIERSPCVSGITIHFVREHGLELVVAGEAIHARRSAVGGEPKNAREGVAHRAGLLRRRFARRLHARRQQGDPEAGARIERAARHRRPRPARPRIVLRRRRCARPGIRHRGGLFRPLARYRPQGRAAGDRRHHRRRLRRRHQRHHAGTRLEPRSADGAAAQALARQCRRNGVAVLAGQGENLEQVVPQARHLGRGTHRTHAVDPRPRGARQAVAVRALPLVPAATRWRHDGALDVRGRYRDGRARSVRRRRCCRPAIRSICS